MAFYYLVDNGFLAQCDDTVDSFISQAIMSANSVCWRLWWFDFVYGLFDVP